MPSTLAQLLDQLEIELSDPTNAKWTTSVLTQHIRSALRAYNQIAPRRLYANFSSVADQREYNLASSYPSLQEILDVWYPYDPAEPAALATRCPWSLVADLTLRLECDDDPSGDATEQIRILYTQGHTINGLDSASTTTLDTFGEQLVLIGAAAYAVNQYAHEIINSVTVNTWVQRQYAEYARTRMAEFQDKLEVLRARQATREDSRVPWVLSQSDQTSQGEI